MGQFWGWADGCGRQGLKEEEKEKEEDEEEREEEEQ